MKPVIGLIPLYDDEKQSYWMLPGYMKVLEQCGGVPVMLPLTEDEAELEQCFKLCDGILLTGGHDVGADLYAQSVSEHCGIPCKSRDVMEAFLLKRALEEQLPILGICRGIQFMNVFLGGTLYQDLPSEYTNGRVEHHMMPPYDRKAHTVEVLPDTRLAELIGAGTHDVNSYHHQAIKQLADGVREMAISEDGLVEAIEIVGQKFAIGVQWHPEFSYEKYEDSRKLVQAFVTACS